MSYSCNYKKLILAQKKIIAKTVKSKISCSSCVLPTKQSKEIFKSIKTNARENREMKRRENEMLEGALQRIKTYENDIDLILNEGKLASSLSYEYHGKMTLI